MNRIKLRSIEARFINLIRNSVVNNRIVGSDLGKQYAEDINKIKHV